MLFKTSNLFSTKILNRILKNKTQIERSYFQYIELTRQLVSRYVKNYHIVKKEIVLGVPEEEDKKKGHEKLLEEIIAENFPKMERK